MANKRISSLDDITLVGGTSTAEVNANDILPITDVDDTTGSPQGTTKGVKVSDLMGEAPVQSVAGRTGAVTIANTDVSGLGTAATTASTDYATAAQGALADSALQSLAAGALSDFDFADNPIFGFAAKVETPTITANAYTLVAADNGKVLALDNGATAMTLNVDTGLPASFNCSFIQKGAGQVSFAGTATVNNRQSHTKINGQYGVASLVAYATNTYILAGDTAS